jgi:hypothetical protein
MRQCQKTVATVAPAEKACQAPFWGAQGGAMGPWMGVETGPPGSGQLVGYDVAPLPPQGVQCVEIEPSGDHPDHDLR